MKIKDKCINESKPICICTICYNNYTKYNWLADERCTLSVKNVSWNTYDANRIIGSIFRPTDN